MVGVDLNFIDCWIVILIQFWGFIIMTPTVVWIVKLDLSVGKEMKFKFIVCSFGRLCDTSLHQMPLNEGRRSVFRMGGGGGK